MKMMKRLLVLCLVVAMCLGTVIPARAVNTAQAETFVTQLYKGLLGRDPDEAGKANFVSMLLNNGAKGSAVAEAICGSAEFRARELEDRDYVTALYKGLLGREPDEPGRELYVGQLANGKSRTWVFKQIVASVEFASVCIKYGIIAGDVNTGSGSPSMDPTSVFSGKASDFVWGLYKYLLGRADSEKETKAAERQGWVDKITSRQMSAAGVASAIAASPEFSGLSLSDADYLSRVYWALLGRKADDTGWKTFIIAMSSGKSRSWVFANICASAEFKARASAMNAAAGSVNSGTVISGNAVNSTKAGEYVTRCYVQFLGRKPSDSERDSWVSILVNRKMSAAGVGAAIASSQEAVKRDITREQFVNECYMTLLNRAPDPTGKTTFVDALVKGYSRSWVFTKICGSAEFQNRDEWKEMNVVPGYLNAASYAMG